MDYKHIATIAESISRESETLVGLLRNLPPLTSTNSVGSGGDPVPKHEVARIQDQLFKHVANLDQALGRRTEFLPQFVGINWDQGALYTLIQNNVIEQLPTSGTIALTALAEKTSIPAEKLLSILRLAACDGIVQEPEDRQFQHGLVSQQLVDDPGLMAFIGFQLYETRVASAHLADSLKRPNPFWTGQSAFEYALGESMYDWHKSHPEKGQRFKEAMKSVAKEMDPGKSLLQSWFGKTVEGNSETNMTLIDITRFPTWETHFLFELHPAIAFQEYEMKGLEISELEQKSAGGACIYYLNSILWNLPDESCVQLLKALVALLSKSPNSILLVNDLLSPPPGQFEPQLEKAYRRRDVTVMIMHNAKLRTHKEWRKVFLAANPSFRVSD